MEKKTKIKKPVRAFSVDKDTESFLDAYAESTNNGFSFTVEYFVKLGIANLEEIRTLEENHFSAIEKLNLEISFLKSSIQKQADRVSALEVQALKGIGSLLYMFKDFLERQDYPTEHIEKLISSGSNIAMDELGRNRKDKKLKEGEIHEQEN